LLMPGQTDGRARRFTPQKRHEPPGTSPGGSRSALEGAYCRVTVMIGVLESTTGNAPAVTVRDGGLVMFDWYSTLAGALAWM